MNTMIRGRAVSGRRRTAEEIQSILGRHRRSGLSLLAFARKHGMCYETLRRWRQVHNAICPSRGPGANALDPSQQDGRRPHFVAVEVEPAARSWDFILEWPPSRSLRIPSGFDPDQLRRLLDVLGVRP